MAYELQEALHFNESDSGEASQERLGRKTAIGVQALLPLIKGFIGYDGSDHTRRWVCP